MSLICAARGHPWLMFSSLSTNSPWAFSEKLLPSQADTFPPSLDQCKGLVYLWFRTQHSTLLNFMRFLSAHSSSMSRSFSMAASGTCISMYFQPRLICRFVEQPLLCHLLQVTVKGIKQDRPLWYSTCYSCYWPLVEHGPLTMALWGWPWHPTGCPFIRTETWTWVKGHCETQCQKPCRCLSSFLSLAKVLTSAALLSFTNLVILP